MSEKIKVMMIDTDENYLSPLETKFIEELDEKMSLEVITDVAYYNAVFANPQTLDILIISENLYSESLLKHNIGNIFVLNEQTNNTDNKEDITYINKYTNLKEIYTQILAVSTFEAGNRKDIKEKDTSVIVVYSPAGGTGKTTVSLGVSSVLSRKYKKILYINAQYMNNFSFYMSDKNVISTSQLLILDGEQIDFSKIKPFIKHEEFDYLPAFGAALVTLGMSMNLYIKIIEAAKISKQYDAIVVDTDSAFDEFKSKLITLANKVILLTTTKEYSINAYNLLSKNINCSNKEKFIAICNEYKEEDKNLEQSMRIDEKISHIDFVDEANACEIGTHPDIEKIAYLLI